MITLSKIFRQYGVEYLKKYGGSVTGEQKKALFNMAGCGTGDLGRTGYRCKECGKIHYVNKSCGNRHCPSCQNHKTGEWLAKQLESMLPCRYFMYTFTLPGCLRTAAECDPDIVYEAMFKASSKALKELAEDGRFIGGRIGFTGVLHTWNRDKTYHPHIHYIVPGGGITEDGFEWIPANKKLVVHTAPLAKMFRGKLVSILEKQGILKKYNIPKSKLYKCKLVIDCMNAGNGRNVLKYLSNYVFRVAVTNNNIVKLEDNKVTFRYVKNGDKHYTYSSINALKFMKLFLQHILPSGFMKIRHYGFMSNRYRKENIAKIRQQIDEYGYYEKKIIPVIEKIEEDRENSKLKCPLCSGKMVFVGIKPPDSTNNHSCRKKIMTVKKYPP